MPLCVAPAVILYLPTFEKLTSVGLLPFVLKLIPVEGIDVHVMSEALDKLKVNVLELLHKSRLLSVIFVGIQSPPPPLPPVIGKQNEVSQSVSLSFTIQQ